VIFYGTADLFSSSPRERFRADIRFLSEPQGEGVAIGGAGDVFLMGEGGKAGGTFARLSCGLS
jgi:hypothetical protein